MGFLDKVMSPAVGMRMFLQIFGAPEKASELVSALATIELTPDETRQIVAVLKVSHDHFASRLSNADKIAA